MSACLAFRNHLASAGEDAAEASLPWDCSLHSLCQGSHLFPFGFLQCPSLLVDVYSERDECGHIVLVLRVVV